MISGDAKFGIDYTSDPRNADGDPDDNVSKHTFKHEMGIDFTGSGTTDGGLTFGGKAGFDTGAEKTNEGTVFVSGSFGTITFGANDSADLLAGGIADVGLNGVGVDNVVEDIRGTTHNQFRYDQSVGDIALAISAGTGSVRNNRDVLSHGGPADKKNHYAMGMSFSASGATVGLGYDSLKTISAGIGYSTGQISANALYTKRSETWEHLGSDDETYGAGTFTLSKSGLGMDLSYTLGASTLTLVYAKTDLGNIQPLGDGTNVLYTNASVKGLGVGFSHDLGGGAKLVAGFAQVPQDVIADLGLGELGHTFDRVDDGDVLVSAADRHMFEDKNVASVGLSFSF